MSFRTTATFTAVATFVLAIGYLLAGDVMVGRWGIEPSGDVLLLGRRIGAYFLGLSVLFLLARSVTDHAARRAMCGSAVVTCGLLATLGTRDYLAGRAAAPILVSAAIEVFLAIAFARHLVAAHRLSRAASRTA